MENQSTSSARDRIVSLLDESSFVEIGALVEARSTDFNMAEKKAPSDGVVTGYGTIDGKLVYVYAQDQAVLGGSIGEMHAKKIAHIYDLALNMGAPVIALIDSTGLRLQEGTDALFGLGEVYRKQTLASGVIPQYTAVFGTCGGGMAVLAALSDFVVMEKESGRLFVTAPDAVLGNKNDEIAKAEKQEEFGNVDFAGNSEEVYSKLRQLVAFLPSNNENDDAADECTDDLNRSVEGIEKLEAKEAVRQIADNGIFVETAEGFGSDIVTGFIQLDGETVGVVASAENELKWKGAEKAERLVRFCDSFEIPVLTIADVKGYHNCKCNESSIAKAAGRLSYAYANASVPMVTVVKNSYGSAGLALGSKSLGADEVFAYASSEIAVMDAEKAAEIMYDGSADSEISAKASEIRENQNSAFAAAKRGYVDEIIDPAETRQRVIAAFEMLYSKSVYVPDKKHGTV